MTATAEAGLKWPAIGGNGESFFPASMALNSRPISLHTIVSATLATLFRNGCHQRRSPYWIA
ncbi:MAG: hypothetical protein VX822_02960 [Candidatus Neomarinimicrobiota bacterium]|nr:hypothetical protein [Candidatus Neomarinimicrobiota bacterium]